MELEEAEIGADPAAGVDERLDGEVVAGAELAELSVAIVPLSHSADSFLYLPELDPSWTTLQVGDRRIVLADIAPAL